MKVRYLDDTSKGAGFGMLVFSEGAFAADTCALSIQRAGDRNYVSLDGDWLEPQTMFSLPGQLDEVGNLCVALPKAIVNTLATTDTYQVTLESQSNVFPAGKGRLHIEAISYSSEESLQNAVVLPEPERPLPDLDLLPPLVHATPEMPPETGQEAPADAQPISMPPPKEGKKTSVLPLVIALAVLLLVLGGGAAYWFATRSAEPNDPAGTAKQETPGQKESAQKGQSPKEQGQKEQGKKDGAKKAEARQEKPNQVSTPAAPAPDASPAEAKQNVPQPKVTVVEEEVRVFFRDPNRSATRAAELARTLSHTNPAEQDAIFRLLYFAAEKGDTSVLLPYAACMDPSKPAWGTIEKDAPQAWALYEKAKAHDRQAAEAAQNALREWLLAQKAQGVKKADEWLKQLPQ